MEFNIDTLDRGGGGRAASAADIDFSKFRSRPKAHSLKGPLHFMKELEKEIR